MYYLQHLLYLLILVQNRASSVADEAGQAVATAGKAVTGAATQQAKEPTFFDQMLMFLPLMMAMMLVFIMLNRPKPGEAQGKGGGSGLDLKKNDRVVTAGGIVGTVVNLNDGTDYTTLRVDDSAGTKMQFMTSSIAKKLNDEDKAKSK